MFDCAWEPFWFVFEWEDEREAEIIGKGSGIVCESDASSCGGLAHKLFVKQHQVD